MPNPMWVSSALYFGFYMAQGTFMPFINLYYERMGLNGIQIGALAALPVLVTSSTVLFWGSLADARRWHRRILRVNLLLTAGAVLLLSTAPTFQALIPFVIAQAFFSSPLVPLLDSSALEAVEGSRRSYGDLRVWGSIGWSISTLLVGVLIQREGMRWIFYGYAFVMLLTFLVALFQPRRRHVTKASVQRGLKSLVMNGSFLAFLVSMFLVSLTLSAAIAFFSIYMDSIGAGEGAIGLGWAVASLSEIPVMLSGGRLLQRVGSGGLIKIAFIAFIARWMLYSFIRSPSLAILVMALHGISFATYLIGSVTYVNERAPEGMSTSAQSVLNLATFGVGAISGSLVGGYVFETAGMPWMFRTLSLIALAGFALFFASQGRRVEAAVPEA